MSFEVEIKFRVENHESLAQRLIQRGARELPPVEQEDVYLAHPSRNFRETHEALRLRREGRTNRITYKGPRLAGPTKTREEVELEFAEGPEGLSAMLQLFEALGFRPIAIVCKSRLPFELQYEGRGLAIGLDHAGDLGRFVEVETMAVGPADLPEAQSAVLGLARELGLSDVEPRSYLRMTLERSGEAR
jgi:adenylate cyclase class 2